MWTKYFIITIIKINNQKGDIIITGLEWENFNKYDNKEYIVKQNTEFIKYYEEKLKEGYYTALDLNEIQNLIDKLAMFFKFKYPEEMFNAFTYLDGTKKEVFHECLKIAKKLDIKQLKYRLNHNELCFLECDYPIYLTIRRPKKLSKSDYSMIRVESDGKIDSFKLESLKLDGLLENTDGITRIEDLLERYSEQETDVDYSKLERAVTNHKNSVTIRNKVLEMTMLKILYSSIPEHSYIRAKRFMRMFNKEYDLNLNMEKLDDIMSIDYKDTNNVKKKIKERKNHKDKIDI